jgi:hypothetical protein
MDVANAVETRNARETAELNRDRIISKLRPPKNVPNLTDSPCQKPTEVPEPPGKAAVT